MFLQLWKRARISNTNVEEIKCERTKNSNAKKRILLLDSTFWRQKHNVLMFKNISIRQTTKGVTRKKIWARIVNELELHSREVHAQLHYSRPQSEKRWRPETDGVNTIFIYALRPFEGYFFYFDCQK